MSVANATAVAKRIFGETVWCVRTTARVGAKHEVRAQRGAMSFEVLGSGASWTEAFRGAAAACGLVG